MKQTAGLLLTLVASCVAVLPGRAGADDKLPDLELLEYLGSWEETDEDWMLFNEDDERAGIEDRRRDPAAEDDESQELGNES